MDINRSLAILESEMICTGLHKSNDVLGALEEIKKYDYEELCRLSDFKADEIARISNYWKGNIIC